MNLDGAREALMATSDLEPDSRPHRQAFPSTGVQPAIEGFVDA